MKQTNENHKIQNQQQQEELEKMEVTISRFLRLGVIISAIFIFLGLFLFIVTGKSGYQGDYFPTTFQEVFQGFIHVKAFAIILVGLILLIFTPIFRVGVTILIFWKNKDYTFLKITIFVFAVLIFSFIMGKVE